MNGRTSTVRVFGSSLTADPFAPQFRPYVYGGDQPYTKGSDPVDGAGYCAKPGCAQTKFKAYGLCPWHYEQARIARKKAAA
jgi:hypothetical protein